MIAIEGRDVQDEVDRAFWCERGRGISMRTFARLAVVSLMVCGGVCAPASAQQPPAEAGKLVSADGPLGSVLVLRGAQTYALVPGDILFMGDRVLTRSNGKAILSASGCEVTLEASASIAINDQFCNAPPVTLAAAESAAPIAAAPAAPGTPDVGALAGGGLLTALVAVGAAAAGSGGGAANNSVPVP
jgi:hypothetical protein